MQTDPDERRQWEALADAEWDTLLPKEALVASIRHLAKRLLEITYPKE